jgi:hypothetical protein
MRDNAELQALLEGSHAAMEVDEDAPTSAPAELHPWPAELPAQAAALSGVLAALTEPATVDAIAARFEGKRTKKRLDEMARLLETLAVMGRAVKLERERWRATL